MLLAVGYNHALEIVFQQIQVVLHPLFALGLDVFERVEFHLVLPAEDVLLSHIVLVRELLEPQSAPPIPEVSQQRHLVRVGLHA